MTVVIDQEAAHVLERWPNRRRRIEDLLATEESFRQICEDYEELADWIDRNRDSTSSDRLETSMQLLESLALEIVGFLTEDEETGRR